MPAAKAAAKTPAKKPAAAKTAAKKPVAKEAAGAASKATEAVARKSALGYRVNEHIVYPAHGVGQIVEISSQEIAGMQLELFVINFDKEKMVLRVPLDKAKQIGMRKLADADTLDGAIKTLRGRARVKRTMWSRRAQEYEAKINSGDLIAIAEVVRDLFRTKTSPNNPIPNANYMKPRWSAWRAKWRPFAKSRKMRRLSSWKRFLPKPRVGRGGAMNRMRPDWACGFCNHSKIR